MVATAVQGAIQFAIVEQTDDLVVATMPVQPGILNPYGVVHAGALLWMADFCATVLAMGRAEPSPGGSGFPLAIDLHAAFVGNQREGVLEARAAFVKKGRRLSVVRTRVTGAGDRLLADITTSHIPSGGAPR